MATIKTCDIAGCALPARTVTVAIDTTDNAGTPIGTSRSVDVCDVQRSTEVSRLFAECMIAIEATISAS